MPFVPHRSGARIASRVRAHAFELSTKSSQSTQEHFPLLAPEWDVPTALNPLAVLGTSLAGAAGAALGGAASRLRPWALTLVLATAAPALGAAGLLRHRSGRPGRRVLRPVPAGPGHRGRRLQDRIDGTARATVTSVAGLGADVASFGVYAARALGGVTMVVALLVVVTVSPAGLLRVPARSGRHGEQPNDASSAPVSRREDPPLRRGPGPC